MMYGNRRVNETRNAGIVRAYGCASQYGFSYLIFVITAKTCAKNLGSSRPMPSRCLLKLNGFGGTETYPFTKMLS
jgi:hypothetical protein